MAELKTEASLVERVCRLLHPARGRKLADREGRLPSERDLAERLEVSRTVIREATKRLELQGVLEVRHGSGMRFVDKAYAPLSDAVERLLPDAAARLQQLAEARLIVEPQVARLAAERCKAEHRKALRLSQDKLAAAIETADAVAADLEFHRVLARAAGNRILELLLESLGELGRTSRQATLASTGIARAVEHHGLILHAVEKRRGQAAFDAMQAHMLGSSRDLKKYFSAHSEPTP
jgi:DNA-binding FadR family transcriptional regulator